MKADRDQSAARLAAIVESSDDAIVSKDLNSIILTWNAAAEQVFGYTAAEAIGQHIGLIIPDDRKDEETDVMALVRDSKSVRHFETVRRRKDGRLIDISLTVSPIRSASGEVIGASKIARDITEEKALRRAATEASRAKDEFLATLSHELRTPLNTLLGYTQMLQTGSLEPISTRKALDVMARNGQALSELVNDVVDASRIVIGTMRLRLQPMNIRPILEQAVETIRPALIAKSLDLEVSLEENLLVNADPDRMRQAIWNLVANAAKFTLKGTVALRAGARATPSGSRSRTPELGSRPTPCREYSNGSGRRIRRIPADRAGSVSAWRWCATPWSCREGGSRPTARASVGARPSRSSYRPCGGCGFLPPKGGSYPRSRCARRRADRAGAGGFRLQAEEESVQKDSRPTSADGYHGSRGLLADREVADERVRVVAHADAGDAIRRVQLAGAGHVRLRRAPDRGAVDRALDLVATHPHHDFLLHWRISCALGDGVVRRRLLHDPRTACRR